MTDDKIKQAFEFVFGIKKQEQKFEKPPRWRVVMFYALQVIAIAILLYLVYVVITNITLLKTNPCELCKELGYQCVYLPELL